MEAYVTGSEISNAKLDLKYNLIPGCTSLKRYSIYLIAKLWPKEIVEFIENVLDDIASKQTPQVKQVYLPNLPSIFIIFFIVLGIKSRGC